MISTAKINRKKLQSQAGVSLMLAVLVLAAITAVAFSLASIVFIEIRSSGDALRTEPTLYSAFGMTEEALFQYKRFTSAPDFDVANCPADPAKDIDNVCHINNVSMTLPGTQPIKFDNSPDVEFIPKGTTKTLPLFVADSFDQQYTSVKVEVLPNNSDSGIDVHYVVTDENNGTSQTQPVTVTPGGGYTFTSFNSTGQYELVLQNNSAFQDVSVSITTVREGNAQPSGLPFIGEQVLRIQADYQGLNRTYQVRIPIP